MKFLVTGSAGFIGAAVSKRLLDEGHTVVGVDNFSAYYDVELKRARVERLKEFPLFKTVGCDISDGLLYHGVFAAERPQVVIHLAAQPGVRYSLEHPEVYGSTNLVGFLNTLEGARHHGVQHLVYASSSSVYGLNSAMPFSTHHPADHPVSLYGATKRANELMAHSYSSTFQLPTTGLRFFTVYGPWGRPDMAVFSFTKKILEGSTIEVFNRGMHKRDFTYIDDIVEGVVRVSCALPPGRDSAWRSDCPDPASSSAPYRLFNIGNHQPVELLYLISLLEKETGKKAVTKLLPAQQGEVDSTFADVEDLFRAYGFSPKTPIEEGIAKFVRWYRKYYLKEV